MEHAKWWSLLDTMPRPYMSQAVRLTSNSPMPRETAINMTTTKSQPEPTAPEQPAISALGAVPGSMTDRQRWVACGEPEIICADDGFGGGCLHIGPEVEARVCEICGRDEPHKETGGCPDCKKAVWWVPKCPECGGPATWTYGEIKSMEFNSIQSNSKA